MIVAGGKGLRLKSQLPKQLINICGKPLLMWTFEAFRYLHKKAHFILVLNPDLIGQWKSLCIEHDFDIGHQIIEGGPTRFHSVKIGLKLVPENTLVAIHDAARPLVPESTIKECFTIAQRKGNAIPAVKLTGSIRQIDGSLNKSVDRNKFKLIQTPQVFISNKIKRAYLQSYHEHYTDDATVLESIREVIQLVEGSPNNIKITTEDDLLYVSSVLELT